MSDFDDDDDDRVFSDKPWVGLGVPFGIVLAIIFCCALVFCHRRQLQMRRAGLALNRQGRMAVQRDMETGPTYRVRANDRRPPRVANRWAWTSHATARPTVRHEGHEGHDGHDGLDENGLPPPPPYKRYDPQQKLGDNHEDDHEHDHEMQPHPHYDASPMHAPPPVHMRGGTDTAPARLAPHVQAPDSGESSAAGLALPPAYSDIAGSKRPH